MLLAPRGERAAHRGGSTPYGIGQLMPVGGPRDIRVDVACRVGQILDARPVLRLDGYERVHVSRGCQSRPIPAADSTSLKRTFIRWRDMARPASSRNTRP